MKPKSNPTSDIQIEKYEEAQQLGQWDDELKNYKTVSFRETHLWETFSTSPYTGFFGIELLKMASALLTLTFFAVERRKCIEEVARMWLFELSHFCWFLLAFKINKSLGSFRLAMENFQVCWIVFYCGIDVCFYILLLNEVNGSVWLNVSVSTDHLDSNKLCSLYANIQMIFYIQIQRKLNFSSLYKNHIR